MTDEGEALSGFMVVNLNVSMGDWLCKIGNCRTVENAEIENVGADAIDEKHTGRPNNAENRWYYLSGNMKQLVDYATCVINLEITQCHIVVK